MLATDLTSSENFPVYKYGHRFDNTGVFSPCLFYNRVGLPLFDFFDLPSNWSSGSVPNSSLWTYTDDSWLLTKANPKLLAEIAPTLPWTTIGSGILRNTKAGSISFIDYPENECFYSSLRFYCPSGADFNIGPLHFIGNMSGYSIVGDAGTVYNSYTSLTGCQLIYQELSPYSGVNCDVCISGWDYPYYWVESGYYSDTIARHIVDVLFYQYNQLSCIQVQNINTATVSFNKVFPHEAVQDKLNFTVNTIGTEPIDLYHIYYFKPYVGANPYISRKHPYLGLKPIAASLYYCESGIQPPCLCQLNYPQAIQITTPALSGDTTLLIPLNNDWCYFSSGTGNLIANLLYYCESMPSGKIHGDAGYNGFTFYLDLTQANTLTFSYYEVSHTADPLASSIINEAINVHGTKYIYPLTTGTRIVKPTVWLSSDLLSVHVSGAQFHNYNNQYFNKSYTEDIIVIPSSFNNTTSTNQTIGGVYEDYYFVVYNPSGDLEIREFLDTDYYGFSACLQVNDRIENLKHLSYSWRPVSGYTESQFLLPPESSSFTLTNNILFHYGVSGSPISYYTYIGSGTIFSQPSVSNLQTYVKKSGFSRKFNNGSASWRAKFHHYYYNKLPDIYSYKSTSEAHDAYYAKVEANWYLPRINTYQSYLHYISSNKSTISGALIADGRLYTADYIPLCTVAFSGDEPSKVAFISGDYRSNYNSGLTNIYGVGEDFALAGVFRFTSTSGGEHANYHLVKVTGIKTDSGVDFLIDYNDVGMYDDYPLETEHLGWYTYYIDDRRFVERSLPKKFVTSGATGEYLLYYNYSGNMCLDYTTVLPPSSLPITQFRWGRNRKVSSDIPLNTAYINYLDVLHTQIGDQLSHLIDCNNITGLIHLDCVYTKSCVPSGCTPINSGWSVDYPIGVL